MRSTAHAPQKSRAAAGSKRTVSWTEDGVERTESTTTPTAVVRGLMGRRVLHAQRRVWAATVCQKIWRGRAYRRGGWKELKAARMMQTAFRGRAARRTVERTRNALVG